VAELRAALLESLASGVSLQIDLRQCAVSVPVLQLLWTARQEAKHTGVSMTALASEAGVRAIHGAGFNEFFENPPLINL